MNLSKHPPFRSKALRQSARGEDCLVRIPGACPFNPEMTIWSHYRGSAGGKGLGLKSDDLNGAYCCTVCDAIYDGQRPPPKGMTMEEVKLCWHEGHVRSIIRAREKGVI